MITVQEAQSKNFYLDGYIYVHKAMRMDISKLEQAAHYLGRADRQGAERLARWFEFYWTMLEEHHQVEDRILFPQMQQRDPNLKLQMEILAGDHVTVHDLVDEVAKTLGQLSKTTDEGVMQRKLLNLLDRLRQDLLDHLDREEAVVIEGVARLFSRQEQLEAEQALLKATPRQHIAMMVPWMLSAMSETEADTALKLLPLPLRLIYRVSWRKKYQKFAALIH